MNESIKQWYIQYKDEVSKLCTDIWMHPELSMNEYYACSCIADFMHKQGFEVLTLDAKKREGNPHNAVIAKWGHGKPHIGIIGELDALPGLGQEAVPYHSPIPGPGHGCGHCLMGAGCAGAAAAAKAAMVAKSLSGTITYFGCPAEETLEGKVYLAELGYFSDVDICLAWHPGKCAVGLDEKSWAASTDFLIEFFGRTSHAAGSPEKGRSALDAAELTNIGVQYLREHIPSNARISYIYLVAGERPNIVPDYAKLQYNTRGKDRTESEEVLERVLNCARGAALMTDTRMEYEITNGSHNVLIIHSLNNAVYQSALKIPPLSYTVEEIDFAKKLQKNTVGKELDIDPLPTDLKAPTGKTVSASASTDVGDVSNLCPTSNVFGGGNVVGTLGHHWSITACVGTSIGHKAAIYVGKVLAQATVDILKDPSIINEAWTELRELKEKGKIPPYQPVVQHFL